MFHYLKKQDLFYSFEFFYIWFFILTFSPLKINSLFFSCEKYFYNPFWFSYTTFLIYNSLIFKFHFCLLKYFFKFFNFYIKHISMFNQIQFLLFFLFGIFIGFIYLFFDFIYFFFRIKLNLKFRKLLLSILNSFYNFIFCFLRLIKLWHIYMFYSDFLIKNWYRKSLNYLLILFWYLHFLMVNIRFLYNDLFSLYSYLHYTGYIYKFLKVRPAYRSALRILFALIYFISYEQKFHFK